MLKVHQSSLPAVRKCSATKSTTLSSSLGLSKTTQHPPKIPKTTKRIQHSGSSSSNLSPTDYTDPHKIRQHLKLPYLFLRLLPSFCPSSVPRLFSVCSPSVLRLSPFTCIFLHPLSTIGLYLFCKKMTKDTTKKIQATTQYEVRQKYYLIRKSHSFP